MEFQENTPDGRRDAAASVIVKVRCSSFLTDNNKTYTVCSVYAVSVTSGVSWNFVEWEPRYKREGSMLLNTVSFTSNRSQQNFPRLLLTLRMLYLLILGNFPRMEAGMELGRRFALQVKYPALFTDRIHCVCCVWNFRKNSRIEDEVQPRRYFVLQRLWPSLLTDQNHTYNFCRACVDSARHGISGKYP